MLNYIKTVFIFVAAMGLISCDSFEFDNPVDRESMAYIPGASDVNAQGVINYLADDDGDLIPNYRDTDSQFFSEFHVSLETRIIEDRQIREGANDGTLNVTLSAVNPMARVLTGVDFRLIFEHVSEIERMQFDYQNDGVYDDSIMVKRVQRQYTFREKGVHDVRIFVRDRMGNVAYDTTTVLIYDLSYAGHGEPPAINLLGEDTMYVSVDGHYVEPGFYVRDDELDLQRGEGFLNRFVVVDDRDYLRERSIKNPVMTEIHYHVYDIYGNRGQAVRFVQLYRP